MITWTQKLFGPRDHLDAIAVVSEWLRGLHGEVKYFSMVPVGEAVLVVAGYEPLKDVYEYVYEAGSAP